MDYDARPELSADYRTMQRLVPGIEALYLLARAVITANVLRGGTILIAGAGGGREIEALAEPSLGYRLVGFDPSRSMLSVAQESVRKLGIADRTTLLQGVIEDVDHDL